MHIVVYQGECPQGTMELFAERMISAFVELGNNVTILNLTEKDWTNKIIPIFEKGCDFVFSFNAIGVGLMHNGKSVYDVFNVPFVAAFVDPPIRRLDWLSVKMDNYIVTCIDKSHLDFLAAYFPEKHFKLKAFLPHGGTVSTPFTSEASLDIYLEKRTIPFLFAANPKAPQRTWVNKSSPYLSKLLDDITDCALNDETLTLIEAYNCVIKQRGLEFNTQQTRVIFSMFDDIDQYIRAYWRYSCIEVIAKAQIPLILYGVGWDKWLSQKKFSSITYLGEREHKDLLDDLQKTRLFLDVPNNYLYGAHERIFNAMLNGAVAVAQANNYNKKEFTDEKDIILYTARELDKLPQKINHLLDNPEITWRIAQNAKVKACSKHHWFNRAEELLDIVTTHKKALAPSFWPDPI